MEDEKQPQTSHIDVPGFIYQVKKEDTGSQIRVSKGDYIILRVYKEQKRKPVVTVLHCMIGQAAKCWLEDHDSKIRELEEWVEKWKYTTGLYYAKFTRNMLGYLYE